MRLSIFLAAGATFLIMLQSCGASDGSKELDSLKIRTEEQAALLQEYQEAVELMNSTIDSISAQENLLFVSTAEMPLTKESVMRNLERYESVLNAQHEKILKLETLLRQRNDSSAQTLALISHLKDEIQQKNQRILSLQEELSKKNVDIETLSSLVSSQQSTIASQSARIEELDLRAKKQDEALARQDAMLNNGYVLIGSKDDLKRKGITKKGKIVPDAALDRSKFAKVNIKTQREFSFTAKKPKILTNMPASSYELVTKGDRNYTLIITNPSDFWRISSYLIIQTD